MADYSLKIICIFVLSATTYLTIYAVAENLI